MERETIVKETKPEKMRVGIVMGGISSEREISLESGRNITCIHG